jgi:ATP-dependent exoDNAse (exonuclease V) beta subunit
MDEAVRLADEEQRRRALTDLDSTLLVEAAAGTGKTSLIAGRIALLLAQGGSPQNIAAITFTELAAGQLAARIREYIAMLLRGEVPKVMVVALPQGLSAKQRSNLISAQNCLDELTTSTIHGFCQDMIRNYAIETGLDPGSGVIDGPSSDEIFKTVFQHWLIERLSNTFDTNDPIVVLSEHDPLDVVNDIKALADLKRAHPTAHTVHPRLELRTDIELVDAVSAFARWYAATPGEPRTEALLADLQTVASSYTDCLGRQLDFRELWHLAHPAPLASMLRDSLNLAPYKVKWSWKKNCGAEAGERINAEAEQYFAEVERAYRTLLGQIADSLVGALSAALDDVVAAYARRKREAAALDFDDLLLRAHDLVWQHEAIRAALGERYRHIFVDEFQDTDRTQAAIIFLIGAEVRPRRWQEAKLRPGSLFLVGDPKQAIYRFRGADIAAYNEARAAIESQGSDCLVRITANFRSQEAIIDHVNRYFEPVLQANGQPGYVRLSATLDGSPHGLPCAASVRVDFPFKPKAAEQRDAEAQAVADICRRLIGSIEVRRDDDSVTALAPGDIALLAPTGTELWRYERALEEAGLSVASQAGKTLLIQQETQDVLALVRSLVDPADSAAFLAFMRGPMVGLTDEELLDITESLHGVGTDGKVRGSFNIRTPSELISNPVAKSTLVALQGLRARVTRTTPHILLSEAIEQLHMRVILAARHGNRSARALANLDALIEMARPYHVSGLREFARNFQLDWEHRSARAEGRIDASVDAIEMVTMHSAKGLEWPVVIPINTSTAFRRPSPMVHRKSDDTLHWVIGGVTPPDLAAALHDELLQESLERERMWYVACTRARDLLIIPELPAASSDSWSKIMDLGHAALPKLSLAHLSPTTPSQTSSAKNEQTAKRFAEEAAMIAKASAPVIWRRPSDHDGDRTEVLEAESVAVDDMVQFTRPVGAGRLRGIVLHKLMEEFLTGELGDGISSTVVLRAGQLLKELVSLADEQEKPLPDPDEMAQTALKTLALHDVAALRSKLIPEIAVWCTGSDGRYLAGRTDALAVDDNAILAVLDWKSDVAPSKQDQADYAAQLMEYMTAVGAPRGALVYMTLGSVTWLAAV